MRMETVIILDRPQMVGEFYEPVSVPGIMELCEKTNLPREARNLAYPTTAKFTEYDPAWETLLYAD